MTTRQTCQPEKMFSSSSILDDKSTERSGLLNVFAQEVIDELHFARNLHEQVLLPFGMFPFDNEQEIVCLSPDPMHLAAAEGQEEFASLFINIYDLNKKNQDVTALSLALYCGHLRLAQMLLRSGARPDCSPKINSLHAAARQGYREEIAHFVKDFGIDPDVQDKDGATPIVYALLQPEKAAWETICFLFYLGATKDLVVGDGWWTYAELARSSGKDWLADKLEEVCGDASSCTMDFDQ
ncbi:hypothetical protein CEP51_012940 [Fusarium floridanum]|uniref:protein S-acyltransferase n=1 Tax=Fusarium floridanum TaxID=1325733 RepID=A0A428QK89_9HYPO|nr:hypothetical protein CEP51_012940 [Fusarium floridanum]